MKIATGIDLIEINRVQETIARHGHRFLQRVYTPTELIEAGEHPASLAARFAAKEAVGKALGTGIGPISWLEVEILHGSARQPEVHLHGIAQSIAMNQNLTIWSISLSHTETHAIAMVVAVGN
jgi:holo-[acyl-carrier protein] synthase